MEGVLDVVDERLVKFESLEGVGDAVPGHGVVGFGNVIEDSIAGFVSPMFG